MWRSPVTPKRIPPSPPSSPEAAATEQNAQSSFRRRPPQSPTSTLTEALRGNPFNSVKGALNKSNSSQASSNNDPVESLNKDLEVFAGLYPDVKLEVLRELLLRFDGESRLHISVEQLLRYKSEWTRGRLVNPARDSDNKIPLEEQFRNTTYIATCQRILYTEFKALNKSTLDAVLAEVNQSYSKARPILQGIAAKSWRATISSFFKKRKGLDEAPTFLIGKNAAGPALQATGDDELDQELDSLFFAVSRRQRQKIQETADVEFATALNQKEAEAAEAMFECQVCYNDVPFEFITVCTTDAHTICRHCIRRSLNEAIFGQGWAQSVDVKHSTLRCIASNGYDQCTGHVPTSLLHLVIVSAEPGVETWNKFEERLAADNLVKSGLPLTRCPFCHYAESQQIFTPSDISSITWRFRKQEVSVSIIFFALLAEFALPTIFVILALTTLLNPGLLRRLFNTSLINLHRMAQTRQFRCKNPKCARKSCLSCSKPWNDPHTCHEPLILSLRTAVEAARTAALKRTCPRCGTSFVKSSGCNKLTCVCGYAMCYLCRKNIGKVNDIGAVDDRDGGEGYRHFCEHFRPNPGQKCTECNKCDLYMKEDEELLVKKAGEEAEKEWREREGMVGVKGLGLEEAVGSLGRLGKEDVVRDVWKRFIAGDWTLQGACDWGVNKIIIVES